jgi:putative transposase
VTDQNAVRRGAYDAFVVTAAQIVGVKEGAEKIWLVSLMHDDLGFFDHETGRVECAPNPFGAKLLPTSPI